MSYSADPRITIDGQAVPDALKPLVAEVVVDQRLLLPAMFSIRFRDSKRTVLSQLNATIGAKVKISTASLEDDHAAPLVEGEVTALEAEFGSGGSHTIVRGFDHAHRLHGERKTKAFVNVTNADAVKAVAAAHGLKCSAASTNANHQVLWQADQTDWEFLVSLARESGYDLFVKNGTLRFQPPTKAATGPAPRMTSDDPLVLVLGGDDLVRLHVRLSGAQQVQEVEVRGWDPVQKAEVVSKASAATVSAAAGLAPAGVAGAFGSKKYVMADFPYASEAEAADTAKAIAEEIGSAFVEAEGVAQGDPGLAAGAAIAFAGAGSPFDGKYVISAARHVFDAGGYETHFSVGGRHDRSLLGLTSVGATNGASPGGTRPFNGVVVGVVTNLKDPNRQARVKVKFPSLSSTGETDWIRLVQPGAGKGRGAVVLPEVGDEVLVAFEHGDARRPYVLGGLYNSKDTPSNVGTLVDGTSGAVDYRYFVSRKGHKLVFADSVAKNSLTAATANDDQSIVLDSGGSKITIKARKGQVEIEGQTSIRIKAGTSLSIEAPQSIELKAAKISVAGTTSAQVSAGPSSMQVGPAGAQLTGPKASLAGTALCEVTGALVKIN